MKTLVTIRNHEDVVGHWHIQTKEGRTFLDSLIENHPLAVIDFLQEGGYDALIKVVLEGEQKYHEIIGENPNDLDGARDALYDIFKYDGELDRKIDELQETIFEKKHEQLNGEEEEDLVSFQDEEEISEEQLNNLYKERRAERWRRMELDIMDLETSLEEAEKLKENLNPIPLDFYPSASEILEGIPTDKLIFF